MQSSPLHGESAGSRPDAAVARYEQRKIIVATNVAETSLTIEGVRVVIDCGLAKIARFDPYRGINTLLTERISRASADQRAGRRGAPRQDAAFGCGPNGNMATDSRRSCPRSAGSISPKWSSR
jgi:hypothetical protein